jgi:sterol desaturase/sphingolipid hydroxylase (fatty acid hydroxylase superfamily)
MNVYGPLLVLLSVISGYLIFSFVTSLWVKLLLAKDIGAKIDSRPLKEGQILKEIQSAVVTCAIASFFLAANLATSSQIYPTSFWVALGEITLFFVIYDFYMYCTHRLFHTASFVKFHSKHHYSATATPWSTLSMHPFEAVVNYSPFLIVPLVIPISTSVALGAFFYLLFGITNSHSNFNILANKQRLSPLQKVICFHQQHHTSGTGNFGFLFLHWDYFFGTVLASKNREA